jgi:hypothetical protein
VMYVASPLDWSRHAMQVFVLNLCALPTIFILPQQKKHIQELLASGAATPRAAYIVVALMSFALLWSLTGNFMAIFEQTACLEIIGGSGCP